MRAALGALAGAVLLAGCALGRGEPPAAFDIRLDPPPAAAERLPWQLAVESPHATPPLSDDRVVVALADGELTVLPGVRWREDAPALVQSLLLEALDACACIAGAARGPGGMGGGFHDPFDIFREVFGQQGGGGGGIFDEMFGGGSRNGGHDGSDLRYDLEIRDLTAQVGADAADFLKTAISGGQRLRAIVAPGAAGMSRKEIDGLTATVKSAKAGGLIWARRTASGWEGQGVKAVGNGEVCVIDARVRPGYDADISGERATRQEPVGRS